MLEQMYECGSCKEKLVSFKCGFCGKVTTYTESEYYNHEEEIKKNCCHTLSIDRTGYGSVLENKEIKIPICDKCAKELDDAAIYFYEA